MSSIITNVGLAKLATASPLAPLEITHVAFGDNNGVWPKLLDPNATSLTNEVYRSDASDPIKDPNDDRVLIFEGSIPGDEGGWTLREVAMFDVDGDMIAIGDIQQIPKPAPGDGNLMILTQGIEVKFSSTTDVELFAQDVAVLDHQGLSNRSAVDAHPASSISIDELTNFDPTPEEVQAVLNLLRTAAARNVGTGGSDIPDTDQLNTRLATTGNLGNAATRTVQTSTPDATAGRLLINGAHGLGSNAISTGDFNNVNETRFISFDAPANAPEGGRPTVGVNVKAALVGDFDVQMVVVKSSQNLYYRSGTGDWFTSTPPGTNILFAGSTVPNGYLARDGAAISRVTYSALFAAIGTTYGAGDGSTTFNVPNDTDPTYLPCIKY